MPYIKKSDRARAVDNPQKPGELNFAVTVRMLRVVDPKVEYGTFTFREEVRGLIAGYLKTRLPMPGMLNYDLINTIMGALSAAGFEFARRVPVQHPSRMDVLGLLGEVTNEFYTTTAVPYETKKIADNGDVYPQGW